MTVTHRVQKLTINVVIVLSILQASNAFCNNEILHALDKFSSGRPEASHQFSLCRWLKKKTKNKSKTKTKPKKTQAYQASNPFTEKLKKLEVYCTYNPSNPTKKVETNKTKGGVKNRPFSSGKNPLKLPNKQKPQTTSSSLILSHSKMKHRRDSTLKQVKTRNKSKAVRNQHGYIPVCM